MTQQRDTFADEEINLREYLLVLVRKWWVILIVFVITTGAAVVFSLQQPEVYQTQTQLLIVPRISERLTGERINSNQVVGASLSVETLRNLAKANDLLADIIRALDLRNAVTGQYLPVESLAGMMDAKAEVTQRGTQGTALPLLTMRVKGRDPQLLKRIADKWAELFIQRNAQLFVAETARSFDFIASQYQETQKSVRSKGEERLAYQKVHPLPLLESQLRVLKAQYEDFLGRLQVKRAALVSAQAQLQSAQQSIANEPQVLELQRGVSNEALWAILGINPSERTASTLPRLTVTDQEKNEVFWSLKKQIVDAQTSVDTLSAEISDLQLRTTALEGTVNQLSIEIATLQTDLSLVDQEISILTTNFKLLAQNLQEARIAKEEQASSIRVVEAAVAPQLPVGANRLRNIALGAALGLFLGVILAFSIHYVQGERLQTLPQGEEATQQ